MPDELIELRASLADLAQKYERLQERLSLLEPAVVPVGGVVAFVGTLEAAEALRSSGFWICDGRRVDDATSALHGRDTPDLTGRVPLGGDAPGTIGGPSVTIDVPVLAVATTVKWFTSPASAHGPLLGPAVNSGWGHYHRLTAEGSTEAKALTSDRVTPAHVIVIFLVRVR